MLIWSPTLQILNKSNPKFKSILSLSQVSLFECKFCETIVSCPLKVNKRVDHPFGLVHYGIWRPCRVSSTHNFKYLWMTFLLFSNFL